MSPDEQERLIIKFMPFARAIAGKLAGGLPITYEDAQQRAYEGLVEAARRFDIEKHDPTISDLDSNFKSFAYLRMFGAVHDEARQMSFIKRRGIEKGMRASMVSLDAPFTSSQNWMTTTRVELSASEADLDLSIDFRNALEVLNEREYRVLMGLAVGAKGWELAEEFGVTESRISQIAGEARAKLERKMAA